MKSINLGYNKLKLSFRLSELKTIYLYSIKTQEKKTNNINEKRTKKRGDVSENV